VSDDIHALRREVLDKVKPVIERLATACLGEHVGVAAYALLSFAVTAWRKTGLSDSTLHQTIDDLLKTADEIEAAIAAGKN
jgi:bacterioferritin (cytochrome b1)